MDFIQVFTWLRNCVIFLSHQARVILDRFLNITPNEHIVEKSVLERLFEEVIDPGWCVACGACLGLCPHLFFYDGLVAAPDPCGLEKGRCYDLCPQVPYHGSNERRTRLLGYRNRLFTEPLGPVLQIWWARALLPEAADRVQYGGVVTALTLLALETGLAREAILTRPGVFGSPEGIRVTEPEGILRAAGSLYAGAGTLKALNQALAEKANSPLLFVGLPCQCLGAAAMQAQPDYPEAAGRIALTIGLFCTLNLQARRLRTMLAEAGVRGPVLKSDFPPPPAGVFQVITGNGMTEIPLTRVYQAMMPGCSLCPDLTAEMADISVGAAEGNPGLNTVIVRSDAGMRLIETARLKGVIDLRGPDPESMAHLMDAAANKRRRAEARQKECWNG